MIGGQWRRRCLILCPEAAVRPTPARLRETLFNWLTPTLAGRRCLDLFAGSGALSFEALSRGAQHATMVDRQQVVCATLKKQVALFNAESRTTIVCDDALRRIKRPAPYAPYGLVFLDPPFNLNLLDTTLAHLNERCEQLLEKNAFVYIEYKKNKPPCLPPHWTVWRETVTADVGGALLQTSPPPL